MKLKVINDTIIIRNLISQQMLFQLEGFKFEIKILYLFFIKLFTLNDKI